MIIGQNPNDASVKIIAIKNLDSLIIQRLGFIQAQLTFMFLNWFLEIL